MKKKVLGIIFILTLMMMSLASNVFAVTIEDVLNTVEGGFPTTEADTWTSNSGKKIYLDGDYLKYEGGSSSKKASVEMINNNYKCNNFFVFNMNFGKLVSIEVTDSIPLGSGIYYPTITVADVLATVDGGFPSTNGIDAPGHAWLNENGSQLYVFKLKGSSMFFKCAEDYFSVTDGTILIPSGDDFTYTGNNGQTITFEMVEGRLKSIECSDYENGISGDANLNGTYGPQAHSYTFSGEENVITATCSKTGCSLENNKLTLTLIAPDSLVYTGEPVKIGFGSGEEAIWTNADLELPIIVYTAKEGSQLTDDKAVDAGSYTANITVDTDKTATLDFEIEKVTPYIKTAPSPSDIDYGKKLSDSTLADGYAQVSENNNTQVAGWFEWTSGDIIPNVSDSDTTFYSVTFTPFDEKNYNTVSCGVRLTINNTVLNTVAEVLATAENGFPTAKENGWVNENGSKLYLNNNLLYADDSSFIEPALSDLVSYNVNTKTYSWSGSHGGVTIRIAFAMKEDQPLVLSSIVISREPDNSSNVFGTYEVQSKTAITPSVSLIGWTYGDTANTPSVTGNSGEGEITYKYKAKDASDETYTTDVPTNAGDYVVKAEIAETTDFAAGVATQEFSISKKLITITAKNKSAYVGSDVPELNENDYTVTGLVGGDTLITDPTLLYESTPDMSVAGTTTINVSNANAGDNYEITYVAGTLTIKKKSSSNGGSSSSKATIRFDTNGGNVMKNISVKKGQNIGTIEEPQKEGFIFDCWYKDRECTKQYDVNEKVTSSTTLYAGWKINPNRQITLKIGQKEAMVLGEKKVNDVAPIIRNDRTMLPSRFVAEALGAKVEWNGEERKVLVTKEDVEIIIYIDSEIAYVNGERVILDSPAFIENDRTYTPIRFISERLNAEVEWIEESKEVIITKNI